MTNISNGLTGNGELKELAIDNAQFPVKQIPIDEVDALADELVAEYYNPKFRVWYCGVIYEFGIAQVNDWRVRAASGNKPGGLFGYYVKQARARKQSRNTDDNMDGDTGNATDTVQPVRGDETNEELLSNIDNIDAIFFGKDTKS